MTIEVEFVGRNDGDRRFWTPKPGLYTDRFVKSKTQGDKPSVSVDEMKRVLGDSSEILGQSCDPYQLGPSNAGLVVGYVQSGKTLSFTTVAALARDNQFGAVIVLAGSTNTLKNQSEDRLVDDLGLSDVRHAWIQQPNPSADDATNIGQILSEWRRFREGTAKRPKPALLITVLKHYGRIASTAECLGQLQDLLADIPVLVIDDESDQASPNTKARANLVKGKADKSQTYDAILELRSNLPHHTYLQYTATPQANLLLAIADTLNPDYAKVIAPGSSYVGGIDFFGPQSEKAVVELSAADICDPKNLPADPPESLIRAFQLFLVGAAAANIEDSEDNRSMLVQVSQPKHPHAIYADWLTDLRDTWLLLLREPWDEAREELLAEFQQAYSDLAETVPDIPSFAEIVDWLSETISEVRVATVNSNTAKEVNWKHARFWVLVGGMKLDRGYTVEGLTVTYMPRVISENADVLQQRARFFGYKRDYFGYCRVFLPAITKRAFEDYVSDEEFLRASLLKHSGEPLSAWRRDFLISPNLRNLTRSNVVGRKMKRLTLDEGWVFAKQMSLDVDGVSANQALFGGFVERLMSDFELQTLTDVSDAVDRRNYQSKTSVAIGVPVRNVSDFLLSIQLDDIGDRTMVTAILQALAAEGVERTGIDVVLLNSMSDEGLKGRALASLKRNIFSGHSPKSARTRDAMTYSGDRDMKIGVRPTLQLRTILLGEGRPQNFSEDEKFPWFAFHLPEGMASDLVLEDL
ncbi:Z1 domain-containing protein [Paenarthrobacter ureafaciens]|uniref:Z1 domain-containing protein n=1 Tax=Paenarthrobacter ureafaciens TaxID=37931 RepID=UPI001C2CB58E|nr:Z1 domain-containing protein [Paenarthrobacter ureafaciens]